MASAEDWRAASSKLATIRKGLEKADFSQVAALKKQEAEAVQQLNSAMPGWAEHVLIAAADWTRSALKVCAMEGATELRLPRRREYASESEVPSAYGAGTEVTTVFTPPKFQAGSVYVSDGMGLFRDTEDANFVSDFITVMMNSVGEGFVFSQFQERISPARLEFETVKFKGWHGKPLYCDYSAYYRRGAFRW